MSSTPEAFTVRWGKLSLALLGVLSFVAVPVTLVLALTVGLSALAPILALAIAVLSVAGLRASAVQDRRKKAWKQAAASVPAALLESAAQAAALEAETERAAAEAAPAAKAKSVAEAAEEKAAPVVEDVPFDLLAEQEAQDEAIAAPASEPVSAQQTTVAGEEKQPAELWEPRDVPAPTYVGATPAQRPAAAPLEQEEAKRAELVTSIRQAEAARAQEEEAKRTERLNLDAVLQRRRA